MSEDDSEIRELQSRLSYLERHIESQDAEFYRLSQRVEKLAKLVHQQSEQLRALTGRSGEGSMPADEKPPHY